MRRSSFFVTLALALGLLLIIPSAALHAQGPKLTPTPDRPAGTARRDARGVDQVWVPAGRFLAGSTQAQADAAYQECLNIYPGMCLAQEYEGELFQREVTLTYGYWIDVTEVSNAAYADFVADGGYTTRAYWTDDGWRWKETQTGPNDAGCPRDLLAPDLPRTCITWYEAAAYARWRGGSLPGEAEWEYAARGADGRLYPWGDDFDGTRLNTCDAACLNVWHALDYADGYARSAPVGSYPDGQSWVGALDMAGNVWEWTADWYAAAYHQSGQDVDPPGPARGIEKVLRGGSWNMPALFSRTAYRDGVLPDSWSGIIGFRVVSRDPPDSAARP